MAELKDNKAIDVLLHAAKELFSRDDSMNLVLAGVAHSGSWKV